MSNDPAATPLLNPKPKNTMKDETSSTGELVLNSTCCCIYPGIPYCVGATASAAACVFTFGIFGLDVYKQDECQSCLDHSIWKGLRHTLLCQSNDVP